MNENIILQVEDDPNDVMLVDMAFRQANPSRSIKVVSDGEQAVSYLNGDGSYADRTRYPVPSLVLLDMKLPRKSGLEVLAWIRSQSALKSIPVVVLTSSDQPLDISNAYDRGANSYLVKPANLEVLVEMAKAIDLYWLKMNVKPRNGDFTKASIRGPETALAGR
jgi:DNA-binding response OmpR family regulator